MLALINDVLDLSRIEAGGASLNEEVLDIERLIADTIRIVTAQAEAGDIQLVHLPSPAPLPLVRADERKI